MARCAARSAKAELPATAAVFAMTEIERPSRFRRLAVDEFVEFGPLLDRDQGADARDCAHELAQEIIGIGRAAEPRPILAGQFGEFLEIRGFAEQADLATQRRLLDEAAGRQQAREVELRDRFLRDRHVASRIDWTKATCAPKRRVERARIERRARRRVRRNRFRRDRRSRPSPALPRTARLVGCARISRPIAELPPLSR